MHARPLDEGELFRYIDYGLLTFSCAVQYSTSELDFDRVRSTVAVGHSQRKENPESPNKDKLDTIHDFS